MRPAPAFDCAICTRRLGKRRTHYLLVDRRILCGRCIDRRRLWDALERFGTRAGIAHVLGLWP